MVRRIIGDDDNLKDACCDPSLSFDEYGNLFMTYLYNVENRVPVALSTDGGLTFHVIAKIAKPAPSTGPAARAAAFPFRRPADDHRRRARRGWYSTRVDPCSRRAPR